MSAFSTARAWGTILPRCPHHLPPSPPGRHCSLQPHTHRPGVLLCPLSCTRCHHHTQILSEDTLKYFEVSSCVHLNHLSLPHTSRYVLFINQIYPELNVLIKHVQSACQDLLSYTTTMGFSKQIRNDFPHLSVGNPGEEWHVEIFGNWKIFNPSPIPSFQTPISSLQ